MFFDRANIFITEKKASIISLWSQVTIIKADFISFTYNKKIIRPKMDPWGTPKFKTPASEKLFSRPSIRFRFSNKIQTIYGFLVKTQHGSASSKESDDQRCQSLSEDQ